MAGFVDPIPPRQPGSPATIVDAVDSRPTDAILRGRPAGPGVDRRLHACDRHGPARLRPRHRARHLDGGHRAERHRHRHPGLPGRRERQGHLHGRHRADRRRDPPRRLDRVVGERYRLPVLKDRPSTPRRPSELAQRSERRGARPPVPAPTPGLAGATMSAWPRIRRSRTRPGTPTSTRSARAGWATKVSRLQTGGTTYVPIAPVRVLDTRPGGIGALGKFTSGNARSWQVAGVGAIPANAVAVTGNVTVTEQGSKGFVSVTVTSTNNPPSSTINFPVGETRANNVTTAALAGRQAVGHLQGRGGQEDPPPVRRDRLLPGRQHGRHVHTRSPPSGSSTPAPTSGWPASSTPTRRGPSRSPRSPAPSRRRQPRSPATSPWSARARPASRRSPRPSPTTPPRRPSTSPPALPGPTGCSRRWTPPLVSSRSCTGPAAGGRPTSCST